VSWRDDPGLVRTASDDDLYQTVELDEQFTALFASVEPIFLPTGGGLMDKGYRAMFRGFMWQAKKKAAAEPAEVREWIVQAIRVVTAALRVEPRELYPDLKPAKDPAAVA
jgi:hypothetical protein